MLFARFRTSHFKVACSETEVSEQVYYKAGLMEYEDCLQYAQDGIDMVDDFIHTGELWKEALSEGMKCNHSIYDMYYLVLARRNGGTLITNDGVLAKMCTEAHIVICN